MNKPKLIQRCRLGNEDLIYDYMGSSEFEFGEQAESLERIFANGMAVDSCNVSVGGKKIPVYMVASEGFPFADYQPYLQQLADDDLYLQEPTGFCGVVRKKVGLQSDNHRYIQQTNAWFDFRNDVLWVLTEDDQTALVAFLESTKKKWAEK